MNYIFNCIVSLCPGYCLIISNLLSLCTLTQQKSSVLNLQILLSNLEKDSFGKLQRLAENRRKTFTFGKCREKWGRAKCIISNQYMNIDQKILLSVFLMTKFSGQKIIEFIYRQLSIFNGTLTNTAISQ